MPRMRQHRFPIGLFLLIALVAAGALVRYRTSAFLSRLGTSACPATVASITQPPDAEGSVVAHVFASYPFSDRNVIYVDKGAGAKIRRSMPVLASSGALVGTVIAVSRGYSSVRLVGSPDWQIPVRIGPRKVPGLLVGGAVTRVGMIARAAAVAPGDEVVSSSKELPSGLIVGVIESVRPDSAGGVFQEAVVKLPYAISDLTEIIISLWTPDF